MDDPKGEHSSKPYIPRATWHGYSERQCPQIEDVSGDPKFPVNARLRLKTVPQRGKNKRVLWSKFLGRCAVAATVCLVAASVIPKSQMVELFSSIEYFL